MKKRLLIALIAVLTVAVLSVAVAMAIPVARELYADRFNAAVNGEGGDVVLAEVAGKKIYAKSVRTFLAASEEQAYNNVAATANAEDGPALSVRQSAEDFFKMSEDEKNAAALEKLIDKALVDAKCRDLGIYPSDEVIRDAYEQNKQLTLSILDSDDAERKAKIEKMLQVMEDQRKAFGMTEQEYDEQEMESFGRLLAQANVKSYYIENVDKAKYPTFEDYVKSFRDEYKVVYYK